jgi:hypothetical protein
VRGTRLRRRPLFTSGHTQLSGWTDGAHRLRAETLLVVMRRLLAMVFEDVGSWLVECAEAIDPPPPPKKRNPRPSAVKPAWYGKIDDDYPGR